MTSKTGPGSSVRYPRSSVFLPDSLALFAGTVALQGEHERHSHDFVETVLVRSGRGQHVSDAGGHQLEKGSVIVVRPGSWHGYSACDDLVVTNCCFGVELFRRELAWLRAERAATRLLWSAPAATGRAGVFVGSLAAAELIDCEEALDRLAAAVAGMPTQKVSSIGWLLVLLAGLAGASAHGDDHGGQQVARHVVDALHLLEGDPANPWTVPQLAAAVGVGAAHLTRLFTSHIGTPPMVYLSRLRAERAAFLLSGSDQPVSRVGAGVGWPDPSYFSRAFRAHYGMSPREYRRRRSAVVVALDHAPSVRDEA